MQMEQKSFGVKTVVEGHDHLLHYTNSRGLQGLQGILATQTLWATNIAFLNDRMERRLFLEERIPALYRRAVTRWADSFRGRGIIAQRGGIESFLSDVAALPGIISRSVVDHSEPYVASFSSVSNEKILTDGRLSQWRGYGVGGGFAIVFSTKKLNALLAAEGESFQYGFITWGDVEYYGQATETGASLPETIHSETMIIEALIQLFDKPGPSNFEPLYEPLMFRSCLCKHGGFREEAEVRIVASVFGRGVSKAVLAQDQRKRKPIRFFERGGAPSPYVALFDDGTDPGQRLPIEKIIVGPHPNRLLRAQAVELLLAEQGVMAEVIVSEIPYVGG